MAKGAGAAAGCPQGGTPDVCPVCNAPMAKTPPSAQGAGAGGPCPAYTPPSAQGAGAGGPCPAYTPPSAQGAGAGAGGPCFPAYTSAAPQVATGVCPVCKSPLSQAPPAAQGQAGGCPICSTQHKAAPPPPKEPTITCPICKEHMAQSKPAASQPPAAGGCPICRDACQTAEKPDKPPIFSLASATECPAACNTTKHGEPQPIEIEMEEMDCMMGMSKSQQDEANAGCPCEDDAAGEDDGCGEADADGNGNGKAGEDGQECSECPAAVSDGACGAPVNAMLTKIFPLADSTTDNCFDDKQDGEDGKDDGHCMCCRAKADADGNKHCE
ncbi:hypothetical protein KR093_007296 [Drosophila rubida]|uniref:Uncharacterized protein n=1 Tax=Drosophila rubida TaxID=30044 RepID=A0AAD4PK78_9MUSC|nr:hypothetical protein KR093_007296 [Drosophila rubida]